MTIVGKILVFVNLLFSFMVGAFAVFSYSARYNYQLSYNELNKNYQVAQKNAEQFYQDKRRAETEADARVAAVETQVKALRDELEGYRNQLATAAQKVTAAEGRASLAETGQKAAEADVARRQADADKLRETLAVEIGRNTQLVKNENAMRDRAVAAEIQSKSLTARLTSLEGQLQDTVKTLALAKQNAGITRSGGATGANPPPENVEGLVKVADPGGLLKLSIGSDSGLAKGHTLEIYRLGATASQSKYLGRVRILDVTPHEAVAQPLGRLSDKPLVGDHVSSRLGGA